VTCLELTKANGKILQLTNQISTLQPQLSELNTISVLKENLEKARQELNFAQIKLKSVSGLTYTFFILSFSHSHSHSHSLILSLSFSHSPILILILTLSFSQTYVCTTYI
jgi:hypothetical protein